MIQIQKWEYHVEYMGHDHKFPIDRINLRGQEGWELVSVADDTKYGGKYIFKRPIQTTTNE